jgi:hypothetical protein
MDNKSIGLFGNMKAILALLVVASLVGASLLQVAYANMEPLSLPQIVIAKDGSIQPQTGLIKQEGNNYFLTANITKEYCIEILCNNIVFDGGGYTIDGGPYSGLIDVSAYGLRLMYVANVSIQNLEIQRCGHGIDCHFSNNLKIFNVSLNNNLVGIYTWDTSYSQIVGCNISSNDKTAGSIGINFMINSNNNNCTNNNLHSLYNSVWITNSQYNMFSNNTFANSTIALVFEYTNQIGYSNASPMYNVFWKNNFLFNKDTLAQNYYISGNSLSNISFPNAFYLNGIGNYWNDYFTKYPNASEINSTGTGDTPYFLASDNADEHPLVKPVNITLESLPIPSPSPTTPEIPTITIVIPMIVSLAFALGFRRRSRLVISR